uniref:Uncharacterized protein n=1 Tax=Ascaris lumbricoides TaxID=6252 RepID=A0A0M3HJL2_ASCLU
MKKVTSDARLHSKRLLQLVISLQSVRQGTSMRWRRYKS